MRSSYNTPCSKYKLVLSFYSHNETSLAMSGLAFSVAPASSRGDVKYVTEINGGQ